MAKFVLLKGKTMKGYYGDDNGNHLTIPDGFSAQVSDDKAKQLLTDYPEDFTEIKKEEHDTLVAKQREADLAAQKKAQDTQNKRKGQQPPKAPADSGNTGATADKDKPKKEEGK